MKAKEWTIHYDWKWVEESILGFWRLVARRWLSFVTSPERVTCEHSFLVSDPDLEAPGYCHSLFKMRWLQFSEQHVWTVKGQMLGISYSLVCRNISFLVKSFMEKYWFFCNMTHKQTDPLPFIPCQYVVLPFFLDHESSFISVFANHIEPSG